MPGLGPGVKDTEKDRAGFTETLHMPQNRKKILGVDRERREFGEGLPLLSDLLPLRKLRVMLGRPSHPQKEQGRTTQPEMTSVLGHTHT